MIVGLFFWFLAPVLLGGIIGGLSGIAIAKLVEYTVKVYFLDKKEITAINNSNINNIIKRGLKDSDTPVFSLRDFAVCEGDYIYIGKIGETGKEYYNVTEVDYQKIDSDLYNELKKEKILVW
ncbi:hypothetical protein NWE55_14230 [Myroides albus]|uniref:hypothetical protein n=1 Tax=Myroides albus TaxID=2562892 RepID=UPI002159316B|nr:hypothetical protein [Myroides albus]UVD79272.1 hypothetical protein NWE55_14230 [Myroides albus]